MEHDSNWEPRVGQKFSFQICLGSISILFCLKVKNTLNKLPWGDRVTLYLVPRDMPSKSFEGNEEEYRFWREQVLNQDQS